MKQVIFLCLLSLTLCLSKPTEPEAPVNNAATKVVDPKVATANEQAPVSTSKPTHTEQSPQPSNAPPAQTENQKPNTTVNNKTTEKKDDPPKTKPTEEAKVETSTLAPSSTSPVTISTQASPNNLTPDHKPATTVKPEENGAKLETSTAAGIHKSTEASPSVEPKTPKDEHIVQARGFDGPSFIGGIILSLGLLAIGFMGFKYYKNQTERNYHTL